MKHVLRVTAAEAGLPLCGFLAARLALETAELESWVRSGAVYVDGRRERRPDQALRPGQEVVARAPGVEPRPPCADLEVSIVYSDGELAVLDKPAGLPSTPPRQGGISLQDRLPDLLGPEARLLHRLDRETSGLLLCSVSPAARRALAEEVAGHGLCRRYLALVSGQLPGGELCVRSRLGHRGGRARASQDLRARQAVTRLRSLRTLGDRSLLEAELETGLTHQIRAHLSEAGLPVVGDRRYGGSPASRLALHAHLLALRTPARAWLELHSPLPRELREMIVG